MKGQTIDDLGPIPRSKTSKTPTGGIPMLSFPKTLAGATGAALIALTLGPGIAAAEEIKGDAEAGKVIAMDRGKGNCIACHMIPGGESPGAIGPALIAMQSRYPTKDALATQIYDATVKNPDAVMPPFGKHEILTDKEFADVVEYIWSL
jgi:sulfur-oxidizing protein SoxX